VAAQASEHADRRPSCARCGGACRVKDYRDHAVATLFGQVTVRLPRFRCAACGGIEAGLDWPSHCRSTPELDRLQAHLSALMTYRTAADVLGQMFPVDAGKHHETLRRHTLKVGEALGECTAARPETAASASVNRHWKGTPYRRPRGTPLVGSDRRCPLARSRRRRDNGQRRIVA